MSKFDRREGQPDERSGGKQVERRSEDRREFVRTSVSLWVEEKKDDDLYFQQAGNLSVGGVFFERTIPHPHGTRVMLKFKLSEEIGEMEVRGEVVNPADQADEVGARVRFVALDPTINDIITKFVESNAEKDT